MGQKPQTQSAHHQHQRPTDQGQHQSRFGVGHTALRSDCAHAGGGHERGHRRRPHGQCTAAAHQGIQNQRRHAGVQTRLRRQARQQGIGQALRDQHQGHHRSGHAIGRQLGALIARAPTQNGKPALPCIGCAHVLSGVRNKDPANHAPKGTNAASINSGTARADKCPLPA